MITELPLFYVGEEVICVDAHPCAQIKNGKTYTVYSCECRINPTNGLGPFCYVGVFGHGIKTHKWVRPTIFRSIERPVMMKFESMTDTIHAN
jgi:hypothetical protein